MFQTINIVQQYQKHNHSQVLSHSQGGFNVTQARPHHQLAHNKMDALHNSKEVLLIDHSKEVQKRKALVMDVTPMYVTPHLTFLFFFSSFFLVLSTFVSCPHCYVSGSGVPEFTFSPSDPNAEEVRITLRPSLQLPQSFYRNCYEMLRMKVPGGGSDGYRVYVHQKLGYSGNAKRFKQGTPLFLFSLSFSFYFSFSSYLFIHCLSSSQGPDAGERAFVLEGEILNQNMEPIIQCQACEEYFRDASRRILLIKNNVPIRITDKRDG